MDTRIHIERLVGEAVSSVIADLARLRVAVFREYPYLYHGTPEEDAGNMRRYVECAESIVVVARDGGRVVGASTATPMECDTEQVQRPFRDLGYDLARVFYLGESVLEPEYRGRGVGVRFFHEREAHACGLGRFDFATFCAVQRSPDDPRRPPDYRPLDVFWEHRGYRKRPELATTFSWKDIDEAEDSAKPMVFWLKELVC
ncbi:MAG: GNAT family N-acetyltransferase [Chloroflexi bacterium]|nr:GNAT family N-acetyltransferase [Chloroflexota bacterium]